MVPTQTPAAACTETVSIRWHNETFKNEIRDEVMNEAWIEVERLVRLAQSGDREAFGELVLRFQGSVFAVARRRHRDAHEAAELVQEVFLHALRKISQLREPACFGAWLQRIDRKSVV